MNVSAIPVLFAVLPSKKEKMGSLKLTGFTDEAVVVLGSWYSHSARLKISGDSPVPVEPGRYEMADVRMFRSDDSGDLWSTRRILPEGINISPGRVSEIKGFSGPTRARVRAVKLGPDYFSFGLFIEDDQSNRYTYFRKNNRHIASPGFVIEDQEGNEIHHGRFRPG